MKKLFFLSLVLSMQISISTADHHVAMDLTYRATGVFPDEYEITLTFYRDCDGMSTPPDVVVCFRSVSCSFLGSVTLNYISGPSLVPWPDCVQYPGGNNGCQGGGVYGVEKTVFRGTVILPYQCADWEFEYLDCCRNYDITTVLNAGTENFYIHATLDNLNFTSNNSPVFSNIPVVVWCLGKEHVYDSGISEADGDSLHFELTTPQSLNNMVICDPNNPSPYDVTYNGSYTAANFISSSTGVSFDPLSGVITFTPNLIQTTIVDLTVKEYRNGTLIGTTTRAIEVFISPNCASSIPEFITSTIAGTPDAVEAFCGDSIIVLPIDRNIFCSSAAADASDFLAWDINGQPLTILAVQPVNCSPVYSASVKIAFDRKLMKGVSKIWTMTGTDGNTLLSECGDQMLTADTVNIVLLDDTSCLGAVSVAFYSSDTIWCDKKAIDYFDISTNNPTSWQWYFQGAVPLSSTAQHPAGIYYPSYGTFDVKLVACNNGDCDSLVMPGFITEHQIPPAPVVTQSNDTLYSTPAFSYQWYDQGGMIAGEVNPWLKVPGPGNYFVVISDSIGCSTPSGLFVIAGLDEHLQIQNHVTVMPNPLANEATISLYMSRTGLADVSIMDMKGRKVLQVFSGTCNQGGQQIKFQAGNLTPGVYVCRVTTAMESLQAKVIIQE